MFRFQPPISTLKNAHISQDMNPQQWYRQWNWSQLFQPFQVNKPSNRSPMSRPPGKKPDRNIWWRRSRYFYHRFIRLSSSPEAIARGLAAGVFAGCFPLFGLQTVIGLAIATGIQGNKIMAAAGTWVSNPLTYVPIYAFNFQVGQWILGSGEEAYGYGGLTSQQELMEMGADLITTLFLGCLVTGLVSAIASYFLGVRLIYHLRRRRSRRYKSIRHTLR